MSPHLPNFAEKSAARPGASIMYSNQQVADLGPQPEGLRVEKWERVSWRLGQGAAKGLIKAEGLTRGCKTEKEKELV